MLIALRHARGAFAQCLLALALLAAGAQAWTPPGLMLTRGEDGAVAVTLCAGGGPMQVWLDPETGTWSDQAPGEPQSIQTGSACSLAAIAALALLPQSAAVAPLAAAPGHQPRPLILFVQTPPTGPPPARGPPLSA